MIAALAVLLLAQVPDPAPAATPLFANGKNWQGTLSPSTDVPLQVGATFRGEWRHRIQASATLGVLPGPYLDVINATAVAAGAYDEDTAKVIKSSLTQSAVLRLGGGWRPFRKAGFYFEGTYSIVTLGGSVAEEDAIAVASGEDPPDGGGGGGGLQNNRRYRVTSRLQMLGADLGWEWRLRSRPIGIRVALGFASTVAAETVVEPEFQPILPALVQVFTDGAEAYLDDIYLSYVHVPTATVSVGWAF